MATGIWSKQKNSTMKASDKGQVSGNAAEVYESFFVPALFGAWSGPVLERASLAAGNALLDIACGTGVLARAALDRLGPEAQIVGLDRNEGMLAVAAQKAPEITWKQGLVENLPFSGNAFDAVVCSFGLMFFEDRIAALREMDRVLRPGSRMVVAVWVSLEESPGYAAMVALLKALFTLSDQAELMRLVTDADLPAAEIETLTGEACFPSLADWVHTDFKGWILADLIDSAGYDRLQEAVAKNLVRSVGADGRVRFAAPAHMVSLVK